VTCLAISQTSVVPDFETVACGRVLIYRRDVSGIPLSPAGVWKFDTNHTQLGFSIRHLGITTVFGLFQRFSGQANIASDAEASSVEITAGTDSISTGNAWRDEHLVGPDFFDAKQFPELTFRSTSLRAEGEQRYTLVGDLTIKTVTKPVSFALTFNGSSVFPMDKSTHAGFLATTVVRRSEFDVGFGIPIASDEVSVRIDAQLIAPEAPAGA
jgi:polyisoprenoid-binding protein YceI